MGKIKNTSEVTTYDSPAKTDIRVDAHWNDNRMVVVTIGKEERELFGEDLKRAIDNCMNVGR